MKNNPKKRSWEREEWIVVRRTKYGIEFNAGFLNEHHANKMVSLWRSIGFKKKQAIAIKARFNQTSRGIVTLNHDDVKRIAALQA